MKTRLVLISLVLLALLAGMSIPAPRAIAQDSEIKELEAFQGYLEAAPLGLDVRYAWSLPGGRGENVKIVDIEVNWNLDHQDLVSAVEGAFLTVRGTDPQPQINMQHGTAVLGEIVAAPDGIGVTGIAHRARLGLVNPVTDSGVVRVAEAINLAVKRMDRGDILLIEQQSLAGPRFNGTDGHGLLPIEFENPIFDAIKSATEKGIVVIEPAGNGFDNLDDPLYKGLFDRSKRDSGAIMVGSGLPEGGVYGPGPDRTRTPESNYGSRVDVQGWGRFVTTCGYGPLRQEQGPNKIYTVDFGATSGAAAMVAGAAAVLQSIIKERGLEPLSSLEMRKLLVSTGTPQQGDLSEKIGPRPNLRAAIEALEIDPTDREPFITGIKYKKASKKFQLDGENFLAQDSVIEFDGVAVPRMKYPADFISPNGVTTRLLFKGDLSAILPRGVAVLVTVFTPSKDKRSAPVPFILE